MNYLKTVFSKPQEIYTGRNMSWKNFWSMVAGLIIVRMMILSVLLVPAINQINDDTDEIASSIPPFTTESNKLETKEENYIYQTDSLIFYFNPDGSFTQKDVEKNNDFFSPLVSLALMPDGIYFQSYFIQRTIPYKLISGLDDQLLSHILTHATQWSIFFVIFLCLFTFIFILIGYLMELILLAAIGFVSSRLLAIPLRFSQIVKIMMLASIIPVIVLSFLQVFGLKLEVVVLLQSLGITGFYLYSLFEMRKRMKL